MYMLCNVTCHYDPLRTYKCNAMQGVLNVLYRIVTCCMALYVIDTRRMQFVSEDWIYMDPVPASTSESWWHWISFRAKDPYF